MNPRLRSAIQAAKQANMPKENISRAISKSDISQDKNYDNLRYEGFGPFSSSFIIETLTDNKNRSASSIRTILQKNGGRLGETGSTSHSFFNCGIIHLEVKKCSEEEILDIATNNGAKDCLNLGRVHEIITEKEDFYKIKSCLEKKFLNLEYSAIEWRPKNYIELNNEQQDKMIQILIELDDDDDVQNVFSNVRLESIKK